MQVVSNNTRDGKRRHVPISLGERCEANSSEFLLLREMAHRINNELNSTISVVTYTALRSSNREVKVAWMSSSSICDHSGVYLALQISTTADRRGGLSSGAISVLSDRRDLRNIGSASGQPETIPNPA